MKDIVNFLKSLFISPLVTAKNALFTLLDHLIWPFYRSNSKGSFGRMWASILLFCLIFKFWVMPTVPKDPPETMIDILKLLLLYVFMNKGVDIVKSFRITTPGSSLLESVKEMMVNRAETSEKETTPRKPSTKENKKS